MSVCQSVSLSSSLSTHCVDEVAPWTFVCDGVWRVIGGFLWSSSGQHIVNCSWVILYLNFVHLWFLHLTFDLLLFFWFIAPSTFLLIFLSYICATCLDSSMSFIFFFFLFQTFRLYFLNSISDLSNLVLSFFAVSFHSLSPSSLVLLIIHHHSLYIHIY